MKVMNGTYFEIVGGMDNVKDFNHYHEEYLKNVKEEISKHPEKRNLFLPEDVWITLRWFDDVNVIPADVGKFSVEIKKIEARNEHKLAKTIKTGFKKIMLGIDKEIKR